MFGSSSSFGTFGQNPLSRTQSTPSKTKPLPGTPSQQPSSIFSTSHINRTITAPPFRNPAFTTPRKPFDADAYSEAASPAESSPAATDVSDYADTPENDRAYNDLNQMTITPATMSRQKNLFGASSKKQSGKGELMMHTVFPNRDKVRKRKRYNDKDISGYRLPYRQHDEWEETDYDSDESTTERPSSSHHNHQRASSRRGGGGAGGQRKNEGWLANFLSVIQRHPHAPAIMTYWLNTLFNFVLVFGSFYLGWTVWTGFRDDFLIARRKAKDNIVAEIERCTSSYTQNRCHPVEQRLPAMHQLCDDWYDCMLQNEDGAKTIRTVILELAEMLNSAVETLHWKTLVCLTKYIYLFIYQLFFYSSIGVFFTLLTYIHPTTDRHRYPHSNRPVQRRLAREKRRKRQRFPPTATTSSTICLYTGIPPLRSQHRLGAHRAADAAPLQPAPPDA